MMKRRKRDKVEKETVRKISKYEIIRMRDGVKVEKE